MPADPAVRSLARRLGLLVAAGAAAVLALAAALAAGAAGAEPPWWFLCVVDGDLWETNGQQSIPLTHGAHLSSPALDAQSLVYVERDQNSSDVWLARADQAPRPVTSNAAPVIAQNHWAAQPVLLPDGRGLYLLSDHDKAATGVGDLAVWELDWQPETIRQITHPPSYTGGDQDVTVNPRDSQQIIFTRYRYDPDGQLVEGLSWLDANDGTLAPLTAPQQPSRQAHYSPDGTRLAFVQSTGQSEDLVVGGIALGGGPPRLVDLQRAASGVIAQPVWRPDGRALAYLALTNRRFQLWTIPVEGSSDGGVRFGQPRQITRGAGIDATSRPVWMSDAEAATVRQWLDRPSP